MSVVAGCVLFDKVVIAADCRLTRRYPNGREEYFDNALKIRRIGPWSVLGFVGDDMEAAANILGRMIAQADRRVRKGIVQVPARRQIPANPLRLASWLPRFLCAAYRQVKAKRYLGFMHAYVVPAVPTVLHRTQLDALFESVAGTHTRSWVPAWLPQMRRAAEQSLSQSVIVLGSYAGHLQVMESPLFRPRFVGTFGFEAIGSGGSAAGEGFSTPTYSTLVFAGQPFEGFAFDVAVDTFIKRAGIRTVGGMRPTYEISVNGVEAVSTRTGMRGDVIAVTFDPARGWVQRNETSGVEAPILPLGKALEEISRGRAGRFTDATYNF